MARMVFRMQVKPDAVENYKEAHRKVWPEVLEALNRSGLRNYSIFMSGTELISYFEADHPAEALETYRREPTVCKWRELMSDILVENSTKNETYEEVFHLD